MDLNYEFPERLWRRPIHIHNGRAHPLVAASSYTYETPYPSLEHERSSEAQIDRGSPSGENADDLDRKLTVGPEVRVSTEAGNAKVTVELGTARKEDLHVNCAEDRVTVSVRTPSGPWAKEIDLPFRVDPDTAKAVFRNGKLELVVRKHGKFNPPRPRIDWV